MSTIEKPAEPLGLSSELKCSLEQHTDRLKILIALKAEHLAKQDQLQADQPQGVTVLHLAKAIECYAPGTEIVQDIQTKDESSSLYDRLPPITVISAALAIVFGIIGVIAIQFGQAKGIDGKGFIDIAKIFAGAIVGSATAVAVSKKAKP